MQLNSERESWIRTFQDCDHVTLRGSRVVGHGMKLQRFFGSRVGVAIALGEEGSVAARGDDLSPHMSFCFPDPDWPGPVSEAVEKSSHVSELVREKSVA